MKKNPVTDSIIVAIKKEFKDKGIKVSIKKHKEGYANGGIQISSKKASGYRFEPSESLVIADILEKYNLSTVYAGNEETWKHIRNMIGQCSDFSFREFGFLNLIV